MVRQFSRILRASALLLTGSVLHEATAAAQQQTTFTPVTDMGTQTYLGFSGGLYPNGSNAPPADHASAGLARAAAVQPLDTAGNPSPNGKIVLLSIGMSNTTQEFCAANGIPSCASWSFVGQAIADPAVNRTSLFFVNGARGGQTADTYDSPADPNYNRIRDTDLASAGATEAQVQVAWVKVANRQPNRSLPASDADAYQLVAQMGNIVRALKSRYPNLRLVFLSSRIYAGYASTLLNPEPYAYESGFAVKWLVEAQIDQMRNGGLVADGRAGDLNSNTVAPWIGWGPYLWANGLSQRSDGLTRARSELDSDGTHPSQSGEQKVGTLLLSFFKTDPASRLWFLAAANECGGNVLCLNAANRFEVTLSARDPRTGAIAAGLPVPQNDLFGYFTLPTLTSDPSNPEVFVKVIDGTTVNGRYWFFYGGLTDLEFTLTVREISTGRRRTYSKPAGSACGGFDTEAF